MIASRRRPEHRFEIGGHVVGPGEDVRFDMPVALLPTHTQIHLPVAVLNGLRPGPTVWLSAAVHGDELNGVEIISRVLARLSDPLVRGTLIAVPIVNVLGFIAQSRYLPDRRDLNRSFPGSKGGSLASRIAHLFMKEIVSRCTHGLDLHTAALDRINLSQVRGNLLDPETRRIAEAFGAPAMVHSPTRGGSLRATAARHGVPVLVFEGGEPLRFNEPVIDVGVRGVLDVLHALKMTRKLRTGKRKPSLFVERSSWVRARRGGLLRLEVREGDLVTDGQKLGVVADPFGAEAVVVKAPFAGLVIGRTNNPVVHGGDALVHVGAVGNSEAPETRGSLGDPGDTQMP